MREFLGDPHRSPEVQGTWKLLAGERAAEGGILTSHDGQGLVSFLVGYEDAPGVDQARAVLKRLQQESYFLKGVFLEHPNALSLKQELRIFASGQVKRTSSSSGNEMVHKSSSVC